MSQNNVVLKQNYNKQAKHIINNNSDNSDEEDNNNNKKRQTVDSDEETKMKNKNTTKRPIICICNDLYAKALTALRKEGLVFHIKRANSQKLLQRLKEICKAERLNIDTNTLRNLTEKSNSDIRVCINSLQFISYNPQNISLLKTLSSEKLSVLGCKDIAEGLFDVWNKLFVTTIGETPTFNASLSVYTSYGEYNKINEGIFVNYPKLSSSQAGTNEISNRAKLLEYLSFNDCLTNKINSTHNYELSKFQVLPGAFIKKKYYTTDTKLHLEYPTLFTEYKTNKRINMGILSSLQENFEEKSLRAKISKKSLICDILPFIYQLMQPNIREINTELMNKNEMKQLKTAINVMYNFGLKFKDKITNDDQSEQEAYLNLFEPDVQRLLNYNSIPLNNFYNTKATENSFNNEFLSETFRMTAKQRYILKSEYERLKSYKENTGEDAVGSKSLKFSQADPGIQEIKQKIGKFTFFDQSKKPESSSKTFELGKKRSYNTFLNPEYKFVYKFNEGVTNTVRRNLNLNYFFK
jgi:chromosome transmission fidelity protein 18